MPIENRLESQRNHSWPAKQKEKGLYDTQLNKKKKDCVIPRQKEKEEYLYEIQEKRKCQR